MAGQPKRKMLGASRKTVVSLYAPIMEACFFILSFLEMPSPLPKFELSYLLQIASADLAVVDKAIDSGFIPVSLNCLIYDNNTSKLEIIISPVLLNIIFSRQS